MIIKKVEIINMHHIDFASYDFSDLNYLNGLNGAGKSTVLQAVQLGLLGYIPGTGKRNVDIIKHKKPGTTRMEVGLVLKSDSDLIRIRRIFTATKTGASSRCEFFPEGYDESVLQTMLSKIELPLFNFDEFLHLTSNSLKKWFLDYVPSSEDDKSLNIQKELSDTIPENIPKDVVSDLIDSLHFCNSKDPLIILKDTNGQLKDLLKFKKIEQDTNQKTINSLIFYPDATFSRTAEERTSLMHNLNERIIEFRSAKRYVETNNDIRKLLQDNFSDLSDSEDSDETILSLKSKCDELSSRMFEIDESCSKYRSRLVELSEAMKTTSKFLQSNGVCPITSESCSSIVEKLDYYKNHYEELHTEQNKINELLRQLTTERSNLNKEFISNQNMIVKRQKYYIDRDNLKNRLVDVDETIDYDFCIEDASKQLHLLQDEQAQYLANEKYNNTIKSFESMKYKLEIQIELLKTWINHTSESGLQSDYMKDPLKGIEEKLNTYLVKMFNDVSVQVHFNVESKSNSFSFGITRDDIYIPYDLLSSGEKCMYLVAFISYLASTSCINVVLMDDLFDHLDKQNLEFLVNGIKSVSSVQYIIAGVQDITTDGINVMNIRR